MIIFAGIHSERMDIKATVNDVIASVVGSAACVYTGQPFDTVKVRMQVSHWSSSFECARSTFSNEGVVSLWKVVQLLLGTNLNHYLLISDRDQYQHS